MSRLILFPALLLSTLAFAVEPTTTPTKPSTPATTSPSIPKAVFKDVDKNKDGALDKTEMATIKELVRDWDKVDTDKNGKLSETEYNAWSTTPSIPLAVFKDVDKNADGALDKTELAHVADLIRDFNTVDTDKNGKLNEAEYTAWVGKQKQM